MRFDDVKQVEQALQEASYLPDHGLATAIYLALAMRRPLLLEGEPGVGKTEVAKTLSRIMGTELIRLQCYEGIDASQALYEWDYSRQLLYARALQGGELDVDERVKELYGPEFLLERPLLKALVAPRRVVLLIDEVDKADPEFEAFLLEVLSDFQVSVPELGTLKARHTPLVILTSNNVRELSDALKRRCLHLFFDYPSADRELEIVRLRAPEAKAALVEAVIKVVQGVRTLDLKKKPSVSETLDWVRALTILNTEALTPAVVDETLNLILKYEGDIERAKEFLAKEKK